MRYESDSMGRVEVPDEALYGAQTQRAVNNFTISPRRMPDRFVHMLALIKAAAARANLACGALDAPVAGAIEQAALRVAAGEFDAQFPVPVLQTGSGTSSNMNMNEVLAHLAGSDGLAVHPNDHVNCSQSSNDVIPSCLQATALVQLRTELMPALVAVIAAMNARAAELDNVVKTGRTHLMDAMPVTLGQEFRAWAAQLDECRARLVECMPRLAQLPVGGSAVGTGVNVPAGFAPALVAALCEMTGQTFTVAPNTFARMAGMEVALECSSNLRAVAVAMTKIANDLRWMASGPLSGLAEIELEPLQPGSSIMPGKVNPVLPEAVLMACADIVGQDTSVALAAQAGNFQLNVMLPLIADKLVIQLGLATGCCAALQRSVTGLRVNSEGLETNLAANPILVTALNREIGYELAARIARRAFAERRPVLEVAVEETGLQRDTLAALLDPRKLAQPQAAAGEQQGV